MWLCTEAQALQEALEAFRGLPGEALRVPAGVGGGGGGVGT